MSLSEAAKDIVKQNAFGILEEALEEKKKIFIDRETFRTDTEVYADLLNQAKESCLELFPALYDTVFGEADDFFLYYDGSCFTLYCFNPDSICGGCLIERSFDNETANLILKEGELLAVLTEKTECLYDIDTVSFFGVLNNLSHSLSNDQFLGHTADENAIISLIEKALKAEK